MRKILLAPFLFFFFFFASSISNKEKNHTEIKCQNCTINKCWELDWNSRDSNVKPRLYCYLRKITLILHIIYVRILVLYYRILIQNLHVCFVLLVMGSPQSIHFFKALCLFVFITILNLALGVCILMFGRLKY